MRHKILIADDSLTIQKVIKITLANEPFDLEVCSSANELTSSIQSFKPNIVLLDFNLSEEKTGYELSDQIKSLDSNIKVFMLFGTFDTVDEEQLAVSGCDQKIIKPFDGTKFINICRTLAGQISSPDYSEEDESDYDYQTEPMQDDSQEEDIPGIIENYEDSVEEEIEEETGWVMDAPTPTAEDEQVSEVQMPEVIQVKKSALELEVEDWGMSVPGVIGAEDDEDFDIPEVINTSPMATPMGNRYVELDDEEEEPTHLPEKEDLEYPDPTAPIDFDSDKDLYKQTSVAVNEIDFEREGTDTEEKLKRIREQIKDEVESKDLWAFDEVEELQAEIPMVEPRKLEEFDDEFEDEEHHFKNDLDGSEQKTMSDFPASYHYEKAAPNTDDILNNPEFEEKVRKLLGPLVEEYVKQYSKTMIEKIAWEVIPDLAENLIRKEIERISDSILNP